MTDITASGSWYHVSGEGDGSASKWMEGEPRKGLYAGRRNISLIMFDRAAILEAVEGKTLTGAELVMGRDTSYGESLVTLTMAPASITGVPSGYVSRAECLNLAERTLHHILSTSGAEAALKIAASTVMGLQEGRYNAFLLYHERDENADSYVRFLSGAKLRLYFSTEGWRAPVWTRVITEGMQISSDIYSHVADIRELVWAINQRRMIRDEAQDEWEIPSGLTVGDYADWADIMEELQGVVTDMVTGLEAGAAPTFTAVTEGMAPDAAVLNELRNTVAGTDEHSVPSDNTLWATQGVTNKAAAYNESMSLSWTATDVKAGYYTEQMVVYDGDGVRRTVTVCRRAAAGWLFDKSSLQGISAAKLQLTVTAAGGQGSVPVTLYGIKVSQVPEQQASYASVFDSTVLGEGTCVAGETSEIQLSGYAAEQLRAAGSGYWGVGIRYDNEYVECARNAVLLVSSASEDPEPEPVVEDEGAQEGNE